VLSCTGEAMPYIFSYSSKLPPSLMLSPLLFSYSPRAELHWRSRCNASISSKPPSSLMWSPLLFGYSPRAESHWRSRCNASDHRLETPHSIYFTIRSPSCSPLGAKQH
jgi:hypothetical protein